MNTISRYTKFIPYLYFIVVIICWFTDINRHVGNAAYAVLLFGIPFLWQLIKPNKKLNLTLGLVFVCLSSYLIIAYLSYFFEIITWNVSVKTFLFYSGFFTIGNFVMSLWIVRNSLRKLI